ncbi:MAG: hypothetical protein ACYS9Y_14560 [Planctomycetota bacterium]|jgi:hypothetical protein
MWSRAGLPEWSVDSVQNRCLILLLLGMSVVERGMWFLAFSLYYKSVAVFRPPRLRNFAYSTSDVTDTTERYQ